MPMKVKDKTLLLRKKGANKVTDKMVLKAILQGIHIDTSESR